MLPYRSRDSFVFLLLSVVVLARECSGFHPGTQRTFMAKPTGSIGLTEANRVGPSPSMSVAARTNLAFVAANRAKQTNLNAGSDDTENPVRLIIAGAPASGKGTQCEKIKERYGVVHLSTGDMLRAAVSAGTDVGVKAKEYMDGGMLVPDEVIIGVVKDRLMESDCAKQGFLLDGFPRTAAQAKALADAGISADCFIFLNVPDEVLVERVVGRRTDPETGKIYHMTFSPPESEEVAARLVQRSDDTEEKVKVRLEQFHANVDAVRDSYADISVVIDGNQKPDVVSEAVFEAVGQKLA